MIRIDRERLIEAGGAAVESNLLCGRNVVLCGQVDELVPQAKLSNGGMVYFDGDGQLLQIHRGVDIHETIEQYMERVPRCSLDLLVDDDGWLANGINKGYISEEIMRVMVLERLSKVGLAVIGPIDRDTVVPMTLWLNKIILLRGGFRYKVETIGNRYGDARLLLWTNEQLIVPVDDLLVANFSEMDLTKPDVETAVFGKDAKLKGLKTDSALSLFEYRWSRWESVQIDEGVYLLPGDKILYLAYIDLTEVGGMSGVRRALRTAKTIVAKDRGYKYVFTLTWLADWVRALGMRRSLLPVSREAMCEEVNAINTQVLDLWE